MRRLWLIPAWSRGRGPKKNAGRHRKTGPQNASRRRSARSGEVWSPGICGPAPIVYLPLFECAVAREPGAGPQLSADPGQAMRAPVMLGRALRMHGVRVIRE